MSDVLALAKALIAKPSISPHDQGCMDLLIPRLEALKFTCTRLRFGEVDNLWARRGAHAPLFTFLGHTDVVPSGSSSQWQFPPFSATVSDGKLYGRGATDMKGSLAAMVCAVQTFVAAHPDHHGSIAFLLTSDEEDKCVDGTAKVIPWLVENEQNINWCLIGEPTSVNTPGDTIKCGRRGSLSGKLTVYGKQGHIAYPNLADNPLPRTLKALSALSEHRFNDANTLFQHTSFQISNIHAGTGAVNMTPENVEVKFNFRYSPNVTAEQLQELVTSILHQHDIEYDISWRAYQPFYSEPGKLRAACCAAIETVTGTMPKLATSGGTSDGRFMAATGAEIIELGTCHASAHQVNEHVPIAHLEQLRQMYHLILQNCLLRDN